MERGDVLVYHVKQCNEMYIVYICIRSYHLTIWSLKKQCFFKPSQIHRLIDDFPKLLEVRMCDLEVQPWKIPGWNTIMEVW